MYTVARWIYLMALIVWVGEVVFFSFVVAPSLFGVFSKVDAGRAVGAILPTYYRLGYGCGAVLLVTGAILTATATARTWWSVSTGLAAVMLAATLYAGVVIQPRAAELRPQLHAPNAPAAVQEEFDRLHHVAVQLNGAVLLAGIAVSLIAAAALRP
ncbi:MAG TPA: DUF4149 domain-containing protein [Candidatus Acidoferrales bacterium]|nr:DUF4149 domain-containing protein [Candidatus Acidoferrales bacterium]